MERCDFSSVMTIVRRFISDDYDTNQTALLEDVFSSLFTQTKETSLDKGTQRKTTENELLSLTQCTA